METPPPFESAVPPFLPPNRLPGVRVEAISEAWKLFQRQPGPWMISAFLAMLIPAIFNNILTIPVQMFMKSSKDNLLVGMAVVIVLSIIGYVLQIWLTGSLIAMAIRAVRGEIIDASDLFKLTHKIGPLVILGLLSGVAILIGMLLCIIPGIIVALGISLAVPILVDRNIDPVDAMKMSWEYLKGQLLMVFVMGLLLGLVFLAGFLACCVGIFAAFPVYALTFAIMYRDCIPSE